MIDDDDNYYDVSNEEFSKIRNTGKPMYPVPVYMQKVKMPPTNPNFIKIGAVLFRKTNEIKPLFARRTKELEQGERRAMENFSKAFAPYAYERLLMYEQAKENIEQFIAEQTAEKEKKIENIVAEVTFENKYSLKNLKELGYEEKTWYQKDKNIKRYILLKKLGGK